MLESEWDGGVNVSVSWGTQRGRNGGLSDLRLTIGQASCSNCSNYAIVLVPKFCEIWGRAGVASVQTSTPTTYISFMPAGLLPVTSMAVGGSASGKPRPTVNLTEKHVALALGKSQPNPLLATLR